MNSTQLLPLMILLCTAFPSIANFLLAERQRWLRRLCNLGSSACAIGLTGVLLVGVNQGTTYEIRFPLLSSIDLALQVDALSLLFVTLSLLLWFLTTVYALAYLADTKHQSRFFGFFSLCVFSTVGIALAGNLITFLIFYELLTLATYPLVAHKGNAASLRAGRIYLAYTLIGGALLLVGVVWLKALAGPLDFTTTGILASLPHLDDFQLKIIFLLLIGGLGVKAALVPLHGWLPVAMAAPAPVSALLHAVAVVKAGAFGIVRVVYDVYGIELVRDLGLTSFLAVLASITIVYGSIRALSQNDLKKRLAFSTVSQVSYIALGAAIAGPVATIGGIVHLVHQGLMKITLFFCAGNLAETVGIHKISEMRGIGRRMPLTMAAFTLAALGMIGMPPLAGFVSKWYLGFGALEAGAYWVLIVLAISSLLNAAYFLPILYAAWFQSADKPWQENHKSLQWESKPLLLIPPVMTVSLALLVGLFASHGASPLDWSTLIAAREYGLSRLSSMGGSLLTAPHLWLVILIPLLLVLILAFRSQRDRVILLAPWAALPALFTALLSAEGASTLASLFFGSSLTLDDISRIFLLLASILWLAAGLYGQDYLRSDKRLAQYTFFYLLAMSGNFGLILSNDFYGFITFFTLMSLASYGLVVHSATDEAFQAGKRYMQWVILGEVLLFSAFIGLAFTNGTHPFLERMPSSDLSPWIMSLFIAGFGVKAGLLTLHVWLPQAHPVAPAPASALLSGIMVKAGVIGWIRFLPLGELSHTLIGNSMIALGLSGALFAVIAGMVQRNSKTLLAYSTVSQMGIIAAGIGAGIVVSNLWSALLPAILIYILHHGIAKAALFMSVGFSKQLAPGQPNRVLMWTIIGLPALALAGLPLTSGAVAKYALKSPVETLTILYTLLPMTAIGTTCLMLRFINLLHMESLNTKQQPPEFSAKGYFVQCTLAVLVVSFFYLLPEEAYTWKASFSGDALWHAIWPILVGCFIYWVICNRLDRPLPLPRDISRRLLIPAVNAGLQSRTLVHQVFHRLADVRKRQHEQITSTLNTLCISNEMASPLMRFYTSPSALIMGVLLILLIALGLR